MRTFCLALFLAAACASAQEATPSAQAKASSAPEISADLGRCTVLFHVSDLRDQGLYNAKVHVLIRHGFLGKRKLELDAATGADGEVRFVRMPNNVREPLSFDISYQDQQASVTWDPATRCDARYDVPLKVGAQPAPSPAPK